MIAVEQNWGSNLMHWKKVADWDLVFKISFQKKEQFCKHTTHDSLFYLEEMSINILKELLKADGCTGIKMHARFCLLVHSPP